MYRKAKRTLLCLRGGRSEEGSWAACGERTAGIGENSPVIRELICSPYLEHLGVELDKEANNIRGKERIVSTPSAKTKVLVIPTNEELEIARHTLAIVKGK